MPTQTEEVGGAGLPAEQYNVSINAATSLVLPTGLQRAPITNPTGRKYAGVLQCELALEGQNARYTVSGTNPTTTNGIFIAAPAFITLRGEERCASFKIIGVVGGATISYNWSIGAVR